MCTHTTPFWYQVWPFRIMLAPFWKMFGHFMAILGSCWVNLGTKCCFSGPCWHHLTTRRVHFEAVLRRCLSYKLCWRNVGPFWTMLMLAALQKRLPPARSMFFRCFLWRCWPLHWDQVWAFRIMLAPSWGQVPSFRGHLGNMRGCIDHVGPILVPSLTF